MNQVKLNSYSLPLVRDMGYMKDMSGTQLHPARKMERVNVFVFVEEGCIYVNEDGQNYQIEAGSYLFLRRNIAHAGTKTYEKGTKWYYIHFYEPPQYHSTLSDYKHFSESSMILEEVYLSQLVLPKYGQVNNPAYIISKLKALLACYKNPNPLRPIQLSILAHQFFVELYGNHLENENSNRHHIVNQMIAILRDSKEKRITGEQLANELGMNYAYLCTLFKEHTGKSVKRFQNELLIEQAIDLLIHSNSNVSEVSDALGFSNPFYFSRVFKRVTGLSPSLYLKEQYQSKRQ
ncbi:AraC family transcriptional regulator [Litchfieldia salsa]|uniref:AraC-type DNA-binding protein n=1 Tax=Litchfieldia salsa TaxID=930152 RepID=A0A1H0WU74_9BACI|nr:AraC family transcriptional regulator [Litchfieldia salsa]SDP94222.1 AraC-type DNA-binding protein [Litchfieldia salsa]